MSFDARVCPIFVNVRDRVTDLRELVSWLEDAGHERIVLLDNDSTYPPLLEFLEDCSVAGHEVVWLGENLGSKAVWKAGMVPDEPFVVTDPDVIPIEECPPDAVSVLWQVMDAHRSWPKAGLGLYLDDTPEFQSKGWELSLVTPGSGRCDWLGRTRSGGAMVFGSLVDTTFALYRAGHGAPMDLRGIRLGWPYQARHTSWYRLDCPSEEERYYLDRALKGPWGSSWAEGRQ